MSQNTPTPRFKPCPNHASGFMELVETGNVYYSCPPQYEREYRCPRCGARADAPPRIGEGIRYLTEAEGRARRPDLYPPIPPTLQPAGQITNPWASSSSTT